MSGWSISHDKEPTVDNRAGQFTLLWNDPMLDLSWPVANPMVTPRDSGIDDPHRR